MLPQSQIFKTTRFKLVYHKNTNGNMVSATNVSNTLKLLLHTEVSTGCCPHFTNPLYIRGPNTSLQYNAIGSMSDWNILSLTISEHCTNHTDFSFRRPRLHGQGEQMSSKNTTE